MTVLRTRTRPLVAALLLALLGSLATPAAPAEARGASAQAPPPAPANIAPGLADSDLVRTSDEARCRRGIIVCVDALIREMERHYDRLGCDHNAVFALLYLRTTQAIRDAIAGSNVLGLEEPLFEEPVFDDPLFLAHEAYAFGRYYLDAYYAWERGQLDRVPEAWRIAFDAAANEEVSVAGNMFLGINAHVNRDLALVLHSIGLVDPDGGSRHEDHLAVNQVLGAVGGLTRGEILLRHGGFLDWQPMPTDADNPLVVPEWRAVAWEHAVALDAGEMTPRDVEEYAAAEATRIASESAYSNIYDEEQAAEAIAARDAYCEANRWIGYDRVPGYAG